jgi:putative heme iron utilization protein
MDLAEYFEKTEGTGILATANADGEVDVALYARPHVIDEKTVVFIMRERLTHQNLKSNHHAAYLFIEKGPGYNGKRLHLTKVREETNTALIGALSKKCPAFDTAQDDSSKFLVYFHIDRVRPLVGETL